MFISNSDSFGKDHALKSIILEIYHNGTIIFLIEDQKTIDRIISHLDLSFQAVRLLPSSSCPAGFQLIIIPGAPDGSRIKWAAR